MPFDAPALMLVGLAKIELPGRTIRLCDGGFIYFEGEKYTSADVDFGAIESVDAIEETVGDEAPSGRLTFLPASTAAAADLSRPEYQGARLQFWLASVEQAAGTIADVEQVGDMELDTTTLRAGRGVRRLEMEFISVAERLFNLSEGNVLSPRFHDSIWPGEKGFDNATGIPNQIAWGVKGPPRGSIAYGAGRAGGVEPMATANR